ncbi:MAG TPA: glycosyltransferase family 39 protein, partial [Patescibacteria group bacterium]
MKKITQFFLSKKFGLILFFFLLVLHFSLRIYKIDIYNLFGWDQVDNAWASVNIIVHHKLPLLGMVAKGNSGIYIGPLYYYLISLFYFIFNLDPIASGIFAAVTSLLGFFSIYFVSKKLFPKPVAYIAVLINAVSFASIYFDRVQWPVDLIPGISLLIFYCLYKVITGNTKYIIWLAVLIGFSFHIHFTSIFYPIFVFLSLPFFSWNWRTIKYILISIPLFFIFLIPNIIAE